MSIQAIEDKIKSYTSKDIYTTIAKQNTFDKNKARELENSFIQLQSTKNSKYYRQYASATNQAVGNLNAYGINTSNMDDKWYKDMMTTYSPYLKYSGTSNTPTSPGKKASKEENIAYNFWQVYKSREDTENAQNEWDQLQKELTYWAQDQTHNYSDDEILSQKVDWSKYKTLQKMDETSDMDPIELNTGIGYSQDAMRGVLWAARNGGGTGDSILDIGNYYLGTGNTWKENPDITEKLHPTNPDGTVNPDYHPYGTGGTNLDGAALHFGQYSFSHDWVDKNSHLAVDGSDEDKKFIKEVQTGDKNATEAEEAKQALDDWIAANKNKWKGENGYQKAKDDLDTLLARGEVTIGRGKERRTISLSILNKMDQTVGKGGEAGTYDLIPMARPVDYKYEKYLGQLQDIVDENNQSKTETDTTNEIIEEANTPSPKKPEPEQPAPEETVEPAKPEEAKPEGPKAEEPKQEAPKAEEPKPEAPAQAKAPNGNLANSTDLLPIEPYTEAEKEQIKEQNEKISDAADLLDDVASDNERETMLGAGSVVFDRNKNNFTVMRNTPWLMEDFSRRAISTGTKSVMDSSLDSVYDISQYENVKARYESDQAQFAEYEEKYGPVEYLTKEFEERKTIQIGDFSVTLEYQNVRGQKTGYVIKDIHGVGLGGDMTYDDLLDYAESGVEWARKTISEIETATDEESAEAFKILSAQNNVKLHENGTQEVEEYKRLVPQIADEEKYLADNKAKNEEQTAAVTKSVEKLGMMYASATLLGQDTTEIDLAYNFLNSVIQYHDEPQLPVQAMGKLEYIDALADATGNAEVKNSLAQKRSIIHKGMDSIDEQIKEINDDFKYAERTGYQIPEQYARNMEMTLTDLQMERKAFEYSAILTDTDPDELRKAYEIGKAFEEKYADVMVNWQGMYGTTEENPEYYYTLGQKTQATTNDDHTEYKFITDQDRQVYYYLLGKKVQELGGEFESLWNDQSFDGGMYQAKDVLTEILKDADDFVEYMNDKEYGIWTTKRSLAAEQSGRDRVDSGTLGGLMANLEATAISPLNNLVNAGYALDRFFSGGRFNENAPARIASQFRSGVREETFNSIDETFADNPVAKWIARTGYEIYVNHGDSAMNAMFTGMFMPEISNPILNELFGSMSMGLSAGVDSAIEAAENGANTAQAWFILGATTIAETFSEAITRSNIMEAIGETGELTKETVKQAAVDWLTSSGVEEMIGETATDVFENWANQKATEWFDNPNYESDHQKLIDYYRANGYPDPEEAEAMAFQDEVKQYIHTAFISYVSAGTNVVVKTGKAAYNTIQTGKDIINGYRLYTKGRQKIGYGESMLDNMVTGLKNRNGKRTATGIPSVTANQTNTQASAQEAGAAAPVTEEAARAEVSYDQAKADADTARADYDTAYTDERQKRKNLNKAKKALTEAEKSGNQERIDQAQAEVDSAQQEYNNAKEAKEAARTRRDEAKTVLEKADQTKTAATATAEQKQTAADVAAISRVDSASRTTQTEMIASVLDDGDGDETVSEQASAAATFLGRIFGNDTSYVVQQCIMGTVKSGVSREMVTTALQNAALGNGAATELVQTQDFMNATPEQKAQMLAATVEQDQSNPAVQQNIASSMLDFRAGKSISAQATQGTFDQALASRKAANNAARETAQARTELDSRQKAYEEAVKDLETADKQFQDNPTDDNLKQRQDAVTKVGTTDESVKQYEQHLDKQEAAQKDAEEKADKDKRDAMTAARQTAAQEIQQQDQQRAEKQNAIDEEKQYKQALEDNGIIEKIEDDTEDLFASEEELEARRRAHFSYHDGTVQYHGDLNEGMEQTLTEAGFHKEDTFDFNTGESDSVYVANRSEVDVDTLKRLNDSINAQQDERTGKAQEDADNAMIDSFVNSSGADEETKERVRQQLKERLSQRREGKIDLSKRLTDAESMLALGALQRKLGVPIVFSDEIGNADGLYSRKDGVIYLNARKANDGSMKLGQALVEVAMHEITHSLEQTKHYQKYRDIVLGTLFGKGDKFDQSAYDLAIKQKQDQYLKSGEKLTAEGAEKEIIADFAKKRLSEKDIVQRFMDAGMGGKMRNMLHNINQALKNFFGNMTGTDRETAENLRRAERAFQKALNEKAKTDVHPGSDQFSIAQFAQATNMSYDEKTQTLYDSLGRKVDGVNVKVTRDMIEKTPVGKLINLGLNDDVCYVKDGNGRNVLGEDGQPVIRYETDADGNQILDENGNPIPMTQKAAAAEMFTGLMNMIAQLKDQNLVWEIAGSTLESTFSALKANSDTQYHDTVDFGTICAKTQAIVNVMSEVMLDRLKANDIARKEGRFDDVSYGLTRDDVLKIYDETHKAGLSVPCPVCYVFSHWMGVPSLLGQMSRFQHDYIVTGKDSAGNDIHYGDGEIVMDENGYATFDPVETEKAAKAYIEKMHGLYGDKDGVDKRKTEINSEISKGEKRHTKLAADIEALENQLKNEDLKPRSREAAEKKLAAAKAEIEQNAVNISALDEELREVEAYNWITQSLMKTDENGEYVIDPDFQITPDEVLLDMRRTGEFSDRYGKNWTYRTSRGAGMGKSILPYSGASLGDIIMGKQTRVATEDNPLFNGTDAAATKAVEGARDRAKRQNLIGGQRLQSTSDFRPEWGLDYIMAFLELQAANSNAQMYTKVAEAVDLFASAGADVNLSIMGSGNGFHEATAEELAKMTDAQREAATIDGKVYVMDFSDVTGMRYGDALEKSRQYDNVQMILVGMNDTHIRLALSGDEIDFVIPWHSSGNSREVLSQLVSSVEETLNTSSDYTNTQGDKFVSRKERYIDPETGKKKTRTVDNRTDEQKTMWNARIKILTGIAQKAVNTEDSSKGGLTEAEKKYVIGDKANPYLKDLYERFYLKEGDKCYGVALTSAQAKQIFPYEYWQTDVIKPGGTKETADENGRRFIEYCQAMGVVPRFSGVWDTKNKKVKNGNFAGAVYDSSGKITGYDTSKMQKGYWKLLIDRKMYDLNGNYREQKQIDVSGIQIGNVEGEGNQAHLTKYNPETGEGSMLPTETSAKYGIPALERSAAEASERQIRKPFDLSGTQKLYNDEFSEAELDDMLRQAGVDYQDAVAKGDMKAAQEDVDYYAEHRGFVTEEPAYHGSPFFGFTKFDMPKGSNMIFVSYSKHLADTYSNNKSIREISSRSYDTMSGEYLANLASEIAMESGDDQQITFNRETGMFESRFVNDDGTESVEELTRQDVIDGVEGYREYVEEQQNENPFDFTQESAALSKQGSGIYKFYTRPGNQFVIDGNNCLWNSIPVEIISEAVGRDVTDEFEGRKEVTTKQLGRWAMKNHYDSVRVNNIYDFGDASWYESKDRPAGDIAIFFNPDDVKSADPVTYGDDNKPIPLEERFGNDEDFRYSFGEQNNMTGAEMDDMLRRAGVLTQEDIDAYNERTSRPQEGKSTKWTQSEGPAQRQFGGENGMLQESDEIAQQAVEYVRKNNAYFPDTNEAQIVRAVNWIRNNGSQKDENGNVTSVSDGFTESLAKVTGKSFDYRSADGQARMIATMAMAVAKNDVTAQVTLADAFNRQGTDLGRALQSRKLFKLMTPAGRIATLQKMMQNASDELGMKGIHKDLKFSDWIYQAASVAEDEADFRKVQAAAATELAEQLPISWKDRIQSLRMLSMLANPRTHIRNIIGNAMFVPAVSLKNKIGALMEVGVQKGEKTKTLAPFVSKEIRAFARQDAESIKDELTGEAKYNDQPNVKKAQKPLGNVGSFLSDLNSNALETEDWIFLKGHYRRALGGWMQANGYTAEQLQNDQSLLEKGREYAITEAKKATYRDFSATAQALNEISRKGGVTGFLVDAALPFKKTPTNILRRGIEYSPLGVAKGLYSLAFKMNKTLTPTQVIDQICSGLSGTAITALGYLLAGAGAVSCGLDDDEDKFEKLKGNQEYAINPGKALNSLFGAKLFGEDVTYTIDWAAPISMPFFVGAAIREQTEADTKFNVNDVFNAIGSIGEPVFNLSMLDGVNSLFRTSQYDDTNEITQILMKIGTNYASSFVPSFLGSVARTIDDTRRKAFVTKGENTGLEGTVRYAWEQAENKIPGVSKTNIPVRDVWGNPETTGFVERLIENFISPGYINNYKDDAVVNELSRLYQDHPTESTLVPKDADKSIDVAKGDTRNLGPEQWDTYQTVRGQTAYRMLTDLMNSDDYQNATDETQIDMIKNVWSYATAAGKHAVFPDEIPLEEKSSESLARDGKITGWKRDMLKALEDGDTEGYEAMVTALQDEGIEDSDIKRKISDKYCDLYKKAYMGYLQNENDPDKASTYAEEMERIEILLDDSGFDFNIHGKGGWEQKTEEEYETKYGNTGSSLQPIGFVASNGMSDVSFRRSASENNESRENPFWADMYNQTEGELLGRGNIDLNSRQVVRNSDGTISTEQSFSFYDEDSGKEVLIPTVINGRIVSEDEAIDHYYETGENLGMFDTPAEANDYAQRLHERQDWFYNR